MTYYMFRLSLTAILFRDGFFNVAITSIFLTFPHTSPNEFTHVTKLHAVDSLQAPLISHHRTQLKYSYRTQNIRDIAHPMENRKLSIQLIVVALIMLRNISNGALTELSFRWAAVG